MRLICLPPAGGGRATFRRWRRRAPDGIEVVGVDPPGRTFDRGRPALRRMGPLVTHLEEVLGDALAEPHALLGLSMGSVVAYELARRRVEADRLAPTHLFVAAYRAPFLPGRFRPWHDLPDEELLEEVRALGGVPEALLARPAMLRPMLRAVRADVEVAELHRHPQAAPALPCPISAMRGTADPMVERFELLAWRELGAEPFELLELDCGHFPEGAHEDRWMAAVFARLADGQAPGRLLS